MTGNWRIFTVEVPANAPYSDGSDRPEAVIRAAAAAIRMVALKLLRFREAPAVFKGSRLQPLS